MQITLCMLKFLLDRDQFMSAADADAEQSCKCIDHLHGIFITSGFAHPGDRIERIIQKMRIDLRLQCFQFGFSQCDLFLPYLFHQFLDTHCHVFKGI